MSSTTPVTTSSSSNQLQRTKPIFLGRALLSPRIHANDSHARPPRVHFPSAARLGAPWGHADCDTLESAAITCHRMA